MSHNTRNRLLGLCTHVVPSGLRRALLVRLMHNDTTRYRGRGCRDRNSTPRGRFGLGPEVTL